MNVGDMIEVIPRIEIAPKRWLADCKEVYPPWRVEIVERSESLSPGLIINARALDFDEANKVITVSASEFGFLPISDRMRSRYVEALRHLHDCIVRPEIVDKITWEKISEAKGMYSRCWRRDQWDWFEVWSALERPAFQFSKDCSFQLGECSKSVRNNPSDFTAFLCLQELLSAELLLRAIDAIKASTPKLSMARPVRTVSPCARIKSDRSILSEYSKSKLDSALVTHASILQALRDFLEETGHIVEESKFIDLFARLRSGAAIFEAKSLSDSNEIAQIRKGISQLYEYRFRHSLVNTSLWLVLSRKLIDDWIYEYLETDRNIRVIWWNGTNFSGKSVERILESGSRARARERAHEDIAGE